MIAFKQLLSAEIYKYNKSKFVILLMTIPLLISFYVFYDVSGKITQIVASGYNPWLIICSKIFTFYSFAYPCLAIVITHLAVQIEYKNNGFKMLFSYPIKKAYVFYVKFLIVYFWYFISLLFGYLLVFVLGYVLSAIHGANEFYEYKIFDVLTPFYCDLLINGIVIILFHFILNFLLDDLILTTLIPFFLVFIGLFMVRSAISLYLPYAYGAKAMAEINSGTPFLFRDYNIASYFLIFLFWLINLFVLSKHGYRKSSKEVVL